MNSFSVLLMLLQNREKFIEEIYQRIKLKDKIVALMAASAVFLAIYGAIIGSSSSWLQMASSAVKLPALYLITLLICLPTLYFFNVIFGSTKSFEQYFALLLTAIAITSVLLFSLAPVTLFFLITIQDYSFFLLSNIIIFALTGFVGVYFLYQAMKPQLSKSIKDDEIELEEPIERVQQVRIRTKILQSWLILYSLVGSQLGWTLRPFFGAPEEPFQIFREREGNFYLAVWDSIVNLLFN